MNNQLKIPKIDPKEYIVLIDNPEWIKNFSVVNLNSKSLPVNNNLILLGSENGQLRKSEQEKTLQHFQKLLNYSDLRGFVLVQGKCDYPVPENFVYQLSNGVCAIFSNATQKKIPKLYYLPMGRDFRSKEVYLNRDFSDIQKDWLCYCNFSLNTWDHRKRIYKLIENKNFIHFDMRQRFLNYTLSREEFYVRLTRSKFAIAPRGNGADSFRFWDCLYLGTVPITVRENYHKEFEDKLPMLLLDSFEEYGTLTKSFLEKKYLELCKKKYDYDLLNISTWIKKMKEMTKEMN